MKKEFDGQKIKKRIRMIAVPVILILLVLVLGSEAYYQIEEQEQAVLVTFGRAQAVTEKGLHFKIPIIQQVHKVNTTIQGFAIGYDEESSDTIESEAVMITSDYNFINLDFFLEYRIADPVRYLYASGEPEWILKSIAQSSIRNVVADYDVDSVLTTGKAEIQAKIKDMITDSLEQEDIGLALVNITIQDSEPPTQEVVKAFKAVETAKQSKETALNNANKYRNEKLPAAQAQADEIVQDAEAQKQIRVNEAEAQVARFQAMYEEYEKNPTVTKQRMFYEAMEEVLPEMKVIIDDGSGIEKVLPLDSFADGMQQETEDGDTAPRSEDGE